MREAFTYMFKDPRYSDKATAYFVICFIALALTALPELSKLSATMLGTPSIAPVTNPLYNLLSLIGKLLNLILVGYYFTCVSAIVKQSQNIVLPFLNIWNSFVKGFKFNIGLVLLILITAPVLFLFSLIGKIGLIISIIFLILISIIFSTVFIWVFANENKISSFFAWKKLLKLISKNKNTYFKNLFVLITIGITSALLSILFMLLFNFLINNIHVAWILTSIEGAAIASYTAFVTMYLVAKSIDPQTVV